jgi:hypothetical protein
MMATKKRARPTKKQPDDFKSVAKRLGADEDKAAFEKKLGKVAKAAPIKKNAGDQQKRSNT